MSICAALARLSCVATAESDGGVEIRVTDDPLEPRTIQPLEPASLVDGRHRSLPRPAGLHVDKSAHLAAIRIGLVICDEVVGQNMLWVPKEVGRILRKHAPSDPIHESTIPAQGFHQRRRLAGCLAHIPLVDMRVDDGWGELHLGTSEKLVYSVVLERSREVRNEPLSVVNAAC